MGKKTENKSILRNYLSDIRQFNYSFADLEIIPADLEIMMGFHPGDSPEPFPEMIRSALNEAVGLLDIKAGFRIVSPVSFRKETMQMEAGGYLFSTGRIIFGQIRKSSEMAFFAATAGPKITDRCHNLNKTGDTVYSYVLDVLGSVVAEKAVERMMDGIEETASRSGWHISESYSPGYCNWDVAEQQKLFSFFPENFCGISLSPSSLMNPVKSISGIIGIGADLNRKGYHCRLCTDSTCIYGRIRREGNLK